jgi:hypothetical protein
LSNQEQQIQVVGADRLSGGLLVHFSDNTATLFSSNFLYQYRNQDHNVEIREEDDTLSQG